MGFIDKVLGMFVGNKSDRDNKAIMPEVEKIKEEYAKLQSISNDELRALTLKLKQQIKDNIRPVEEEIDSLKAQAEAPGCEASVSEEIYGKVDALIKDIDTKIEETLDKILPQAFAIVKETARRFSENETIEATATQFDRDLAATRSSVEIKGDKVIYHNRWIAGGTEIKWDMVHYDVQLIGGVALHQGRIAEMGTGEGKTLVATLPVFLNALAEKGVHLVTVNDYLAKRDSEWMGPIYEFHGLSVDCIDKHRPNSEERRKAYSSHITFGTNNEFGFDYLRDNMAINKDDIVQPKHHYAIVDEVDSVLIDDARTPLIISGPVPKGGDQLFDEMKPKVMKLYQVQRTLVNQLLADAKRLIKEGNEKDGGFKLLQAFKGLPKNKAITKYLSELGMKTLMHKTENIYLADNAKRMGEVTEELYFVIEEKQNSVEMTERGIDLITGSSEDREFFILPDIGSEVAEIDKEDLSDEDKLIRKDKMLNDYALKSERVHTINQLLKAYALFEIDVEYVVIDNKVKIVDEQTGRIMEGRRYSDGLHQAIEAKENVKIEDATQTFATITLQNYFRMYHKLAGMTGTAETEAGELWDIYKLDVMVIPTNRPIVRDDREDLVYKTKREKYNAVITEIVELTQAGRPVLVGTTSVEISELLSKSLSMRNIKHNVLNAKLHQREADIVADAGKASTVTIATNMAGRGTDIKLSEEVKKAGGLAIVGTERHESRRVDRQLRGRAGRQGDPGSSQFFVCLEDDLMRLFGSDRIAKLMDRMGIKEGEVIQHSMISKSIERAQKKVEENNFGIRKRLLEYDDVMNNQREVIYKKRRFSLHGERLDLEISNMLYEVCDSIVSECHGQIEYPEFKEQLIRQISIDCPVTEAEYLKMNTDELVEIINKKLVATYKRKIELIRKTALPVITDVYKRQSQFYRNIVIPITDGKKLFNVITPLEKSVENEGSELIKSYQKSILLAIIDDAWKEHLREMDELKHAVQSASYEQKDPLLIYKFESFNLFKTMLDKINKDVGAFLMKGFIPNRESSEIREAEERKSLDMSKYQTSRESAASEEKKTEKKVEPIRVEKKVGRNEPCPCGSGKKYKQCHGKDEVA